MQSKKKTPVAVLRTKLGLTVKEFAELIGKSVWSVTSLETGRLNLSEETAIKISDETGVAMKWLLDGKPKEKPYETDPIDGSKHPYTKEIFERIQAHKKKGITYSSNPNTRLVRAIAAATPWLSVFNAADEAGRSDLAVYLLHQSLDGLVERLGKDDAAMMKINKGARIVDASGSEWIFSQDGAGSMKGITLEKVASGKRTPKK
jgi:transcriptional regulator with XRE-family HTH domain